IERRHRIEEACGQPAEAAVTEGSVGLLIEQDLQVDSVLGEKITAGVDDAEVEKIVFQRAADQKFERQIIELLGIAAIESHARREHFIHEHVANHQCRRPVPVVLRQIDPHLGQGETDVMIDKLVEEVASSFRKWRNSHSWVSPKQISEQSPLRSISYADLSPIEHGSEIGDPST